MEKRIPKPSVKEIKKYKEKYKVMVNYKHQERSLNKLFHGMDIDRNNKIENILLKVCCLNQFYSTNIFNVYAIAEHILELGIDRRLNKLDLKLVNDIAKVKIKKKTINFYSFASKYCSHHHTDFYPIYDSFVEKMLMHFKKKDEFFKFKKSDLKDYPAFYEIIYSFMEFYGLEKQNLRDVDRYLWIAGKKHFPRNYKKKSV